jgi:hypothetical protein
MATLATANAAHALIVRPLVPKRALFLRALDFRVTPISPSRLEAATP